MTVAQLHATALTQREVAAKTLVVLLEAGVLNRDARTLARAAHELGLYVDEVREAWRHHQHGWQPSAIDRAPDRPRLVPDPAPEPRPGERGGGRRRNLHPAPDGGLQRRCVRCKDLKPATPEHFYVKNKTTGALRSICRPCSVIYQRERYLTQRALAQLDAAGLRFVATGTDSAIVCRGCGDPIGEGNEAVALAEVWHALCLDQAT